MLFVVRHGERADYAGADEMKNIQNPFDPHLTELGRIQARKTGDHILKLLKESDLESKDLRYLIISSPFRRCIETSYHISQALPKENIWGNKIYLDNFLSEHLDPLYFKRSILSELQVRTDIKEIQKTIDFELQDGFSEAGNHLSTPIYPEGKTISQRVSQGFNQLKSHYFSDINKENNVVVILVSHGIITEAFLNMHASLDYKKGIHSTSLSQFTLEADSMGKPVVTQYHEQLREADEEYKIALRQKYKKYSCNF